MVHLSNNCKKQFINKPKQDKKIYGSSYPKAHQEYIECHKQVNIAHDIPKKDYSLKCKIYY